MPASGPENFDVHLDATDTAPVSEPAAVPYALVKMTPDIVSIVARYEPRGLAGAFPDKGLPPARIKFGIGDVVSVTIF
jgi:polysaccharide export outer membrane protein